MKAYHGTDNEFKEFDPSFFGQNTDGNASDESYAETARFGFWFTDNPDKAAEYYDKVMECELAIENPYHIESLWILANWVECTCMTAEELRNQLIEEGYDGIVIDYDEEFEGTSYIPFSTNQITIL